MRFLILPLVLLASACGEAAETDTSASDPAQVAAAREALATACRAKEGETEASCGCYVDRVAAALTPKQMQVLAEGDAAAPEAQADLARTEKYAEVVTAQAACLVNG